jgi:hypothetical protein
VAPDGFIDYQVDFTKPLSEKDDNSWAEGVSDDSETYEMWDESQDQEEQEPEPMVVEDPDGPEIIYNIHGEIIGPESVL